MMLETTVKYSVVRAFVHVILRYSVELLTLMLKYKNKTKTQKKTNTNIFSPMDPDLHKTAEFFLYS